MAEPINFYTDENTGHEIAVYASGLERDTVTNRIVKPAPGTIITPEKSAEFHQRKRELGIIAQLRGLNDEVSPEATLDDIVNGAAAKVEAITRHAVKTFMESKTSRSQEGMYPKLMQALLGEQERAGTPVVIVNQPSYTSEQARAILKVTGDIRRVQNGEVVEGQEVKHE